LILARYSRPDYRAVLLDELSDDIVERLEIALVNLNVPVAVGHDVVAVPLAPRGRVSLSFSPCEVM